MLKHVDLCSGIGGFALGFQWAGLSDPVLFCDVDPFCRKVLAKNFPGVALSEDVKELASDAKRLVPDCDVLTAGYPCQPFSTSGERKGEEDERHIWPYIRSIVSEKRPSWCVFENVSGHVTLGLDRVLSDLEEEGYTTESFIIPASAVGAYHRRDRVWIVAYSPSERLKGQRTFRQPFRSSESFFREASGFIDAFQRKDLPFLCGSHDGLSTRMDRNNEKRLHALGNAIVPQIAYRIGLAIRATYELEE